VLDLVEKSSGDRKFLKAGSRDQADKLLAQRRAYILVEIKKNPVEGEEDEAKQIQFNGAAVRTPAEDIIWEEQQKELEANAPVKGKDPKGKPPAKKK